MPLLAPESSVASFRERTRHSVAAGSRAEVSAEPAEPVSKVSGEEAVERKLSEGLQDFTDSIVRAPRRLRACSSLAVP